MMNYLKTITISLALLACALICSCNCQEKSLPAPDSPELIVIESANLKCNDSILVFTPQCCGKALQEGKAIPTLFLLHGWSGCYKDWSNKHDIQEISNRTGFRIICPDGFYNGWYLNNTDTTKMQWRSFFDQECFPQLKEKFDLVADSTFITGLSMGGHGAVNLFLDHPENFRAAGSMSGVLDLQLTSLRDTELAKVIGDKKERIDAESAVTRVAEKAELLKQMNKPIIVTCGYNDVYVCCTDVFSQKCRELDVPHIKILSPGKHSWPYWGFALEQHLWHFNKILKGDNLGY